MTLNALKFPNLFKLYLQFKAQLSTQCSRFQGSKHWLVLSLALICGCPWMPCKLQKPPHFSHRIRIQRFELIWRQIKEYLILIFHLFITGLRRLWISLKLTSFKEMNLLINMVWAMYLLVIRRLLRRYYLGVLFWLLQFVLLFLSWQLYFLNLNCWCQSRMF